MQININHGLFPFLKQKIEVLNEDEEGDDDDYNGDLVSSDIEQIQNLLEFKVNTHTHARQAAVISDRCLLNAFHLFQHEEVQFLENELENQKQKYQELASFTKSLLTALRNKDLERQQVTSPMRAFISRNMSCVQGHLI